MNADQTSLIQTRRLVEPRHRPEGDTLSGIDRFLALEGIRETKARYCRAIDDRDWDELRRVFTDDCDVDWPLPNATIRAANDFVGFLREAITPGVQTRHQTFNLVAEFVSADEALVRWDHENWSWFAGEATYSIHQWGEYREIYRKTGSGWLICYFSEQHLYNARGSVRRPVGIGDVAVD